MIVMNKIKIGKGTYLYPMPVVIVGANVDNKANFTTVSYVGVIHTNPPLISVTLANSRFSLKGINQNKNFSINIPSVNMVKETDFVGMHSGFKKDKSEIFDYEYGSLKTTPLILNSPLNMECKLNNIIELSSKSSLVIGEILETYAREEVINNGIPDIKKINPLLYTMKDFKYWEVGNEIGNAFCIGKDI